MRSKEDLIKFLGNYIKGNEKSIRSFTQKLEVITNNEDSLSVSIVTRLLGHKTDAKEETVRKLAVIIFDDVNATANHLWEKIISDKYADADLDAETILRVATGFTTWSSPILSLIDAKSTDSLFPKGIKFVFCNEKKGNIEVPFWVKDKNDLQRLRKTPEVFTHKYLALDLNVLLNEGKIDCAFLLRPTFDAMEFPNLTSKPLLVSRIGVGHGTHMYVIRKKEVEEIAKTSKNEIVPTKSLDDLFAARKYFCDLVKGKVVRTAIIGNKTIKNHQVDFFSDPMVSESLKQSRGLDEINIGDSSYNEYLQSITYSLNYRSIDQKISDKDLNTYPIDIFIVIAFEPLNSIIYHDLINIPGNTDLIYSNFNISKMVDGRVSYCLYANVEAIKNQKKFKKMMDFLNSIDNHVKSESDSNKFNADLAQRLSDLYYPNSFKKTDSSEELHDDISTIDRMKNALDELTYSNHSVALINTIVNNLKN